MNWINNVVRPKIRSILRKEGINGAVTGAGSDVSTPLLKLERDVAVKLEQFPATIEQARSEHDPSVIANYVFNLAKTFNSFYTEHSVSNAETPEKKTLRLRLAVMTANTLKSGMQLLGIKVPERM